jgi:hypothetical protein
MIPGYRRDTRMILRLIRNSIQNYGWRKDRLMDPIKIDFTVSQTLQPRTCGRREVFKSLDA